MPLTLWCSGLMAIISLQFSILYFRPITGRVINRHRSSNIWNICFCDLFFCARMWLPSKVSRSNHSNVDSDEVAIMLTVISWVEIIIEQGHTLHPKGYSVLHLEAMERSIGHKETHELAMVDTFRTPLW
jgi:hypothetical protein